MECQLIKLKKIYPARFSSEAIEEIAYLNRKGKSKKTARLFSNA